ncbi:MAG: hypothetical protein HC905_05890 [Bacteroidales bacterium]|nr:hypothetical protein [Bacteroidales bacterium]
MIIKPLIISGTKSRELTRIDESTSTFSEDWLQNIIHENPQCYPIENPFDSNLKIISLGREIDSGAGFIDVLLLTSEADLIVVETKLWRNPEKSRTVLAQVIDYAKELSKWNFMDLNDAIITSQKSINSNKILSLEEIIKKEFPGKSTDLIEQLNKKLNEGCLKLSIVGDKISPNLMLLSDTIQSSPGLNFSLSLIEMKLFRCNDGIILIPDIVGKTVEIVRGIIRVQYNNEKPKVDIQLEDEKQQPKTKTNKETFISQCRADKAPLLDIWINEWLNNPELFLYWGVMGFSVKDALTINGLQFWIYIPHIFQ